MFVTYIKNKKHVPGYGNTENESINDVTCFGTDWDKAVTVRYVDAPAYIQRKVLTKLDRMRQDYWKGCAR